MKLCTIGHTFRYEMEKLCRLFFPFEKMIFSDCEETDSFCVLTWRTEQSDGVLLRSKVVFGDTVYDDSELVSLEELKKEKGEDERRLAVLLFNQLCDFTNCRPDWGILTGVRPAKLYRSLVNTGGEEYANDYFINRLCVNPNKLQLCAAASHSEDEIIALSKSDSFSLYVSIPFCPTRCSYCSFVSHSVDKAGRLISEYLKLLRTEIEQTARIAKELKLSLQTVYIGGGTPSVLSANELEELISCIKSNFDMSACLEFTVEAGRPDTITREKLEVLKRGGVTRISINPQTMNDEVLSIIGRRHTARQAEDAFLLAREVGLDNINMDVIAGLPGDNFESFVNTIERIISLSPESVTVHSLSMKRASTMTVQGEKPSANTGDDAAKMVEFAEKRLRAEGILPYYMYRQSKTVGNLENVGYSRQGYECLYNVYIMDETHTILACGASGVTKLKEYGVNNIQRIYNFKYPYEYISRFDEILKRKYGVGEFYEKYGK